MPPPHRDHLGGRHVIDSRTGGADETPLVRCPSGETIGEKNARDIFYINADVLQMSAYGEAGRRWTWDIGPRHIDIHGSQLTLINVLPVLQWGWGPHWRIHHRREKILQPRSSREVPSWTRPRVSSIPYDRCVPPLPTWNSLPRVPGGDVTTVVLDPMVTEGNVRVDGNRVRKNSSGDLWIISTSSSRLPSWSWLPDSSRLQLTEERRGITADRALSTVSGPD
jgi:hypothetical protein